MLFYSDDFTKDVGLFLQNIKYSVCKSKDTEYINIACSFDIETYSFYENCEKRSIMYIWQFAIDDNVLIGRTWEQFIILNKKLSVFFDLNDKRRLIIYVHNLAYEFQFMRKWFEWREVFATDERKPLKVLNEYNIEYRCSYRLSGYSLATVAKNLTRHKISKLVGDLDYTIARCPKTKLDVNELQYCINDVLIVTAYIKECIEDYRNIANIPLTQTGKVRKYVRKIVFNNNRYKYLMRKLELNNLEYVQLRKAFQGGFTHANAMYSNQLCEDVTSYDFTSSYPSVMVCEKFPMSKGKYVGKVSLEQLRTYIQNYCCLFDIKLSDICSKYIFENVISMSKCSDIHNYVVNNGRVVSADSLITTITDVDFDIITRFYNYSGIEIRNLYIYEKNYLPKDFILSVLKLYGDKTELKGIQGKEIEYLHSKEMLNSCYGMCVTNVMNNEVIYSGDEWKLGNVDIFEVIDKYNNDRNRFLFYPWGVWVTAYARKNLFTGVYECKEDYIYSDTDSIKLFNVENHIQYFKNYNDNIKRKMIDMCKYYNIDVNLVCPKTKENTEKWLGVWDFDGHYKMFKTLGAKRYMTYNDNNELSLTVSGVNKKIAIPYLLEKYSNNIADIFNNFNNGLIFPKDYSGKKILTYNDNEITGTIKDCQNNYYRYYEKSYIHMENGEYNLNIACDYLDYLLKLNKREV